MGLNNYNVGTKLPDSITLASNNNSDIKIIHKFGFTPTPPVAGDLFQLWDKGIIYTYATTAVTLGVSSSDAKDTSAGVGARTVEIQGLDADYEELSETVTLNGKIKVESTNKFLRVFRVKVLTAGSEGDNAGMIYIYDTASAVIAGVPQTASKIMAAITVGYNQTNMAIYTIPAGYTGFLINVWGAMNARSNKYADIQMYRREYGSVFQNKFVYGINGAGAYFQRHFTIAEKIEEKTDIELKTICDSATTRISGGFDILLVKN